MMDQLEDDIQRYNIEELLKELGAKYFLVEKFESSDYDGYACVYLAEQDDFDKENVLLDKGFEEIKPGFFIIDIKLLKDIPDVEIKKIKLLHSERLKLENNAFQFQKRYLEVNKLWNKIVKKYIDINTLFFRFHNVFYFEPTNRTLEIALNIPLKLVNDEKSLGEFCYLLYQLMYECVKNETRDYIGKIIAERVSTIKTSNDGKVYFINNLLGNDKFYNDIKELRHYFNHIYLTDNSRTLTHEERETKFMECIEKRMLNKLTNDYEYFHFQVELLNDCYIYLKKIYDIFSTKEIVR